MCSSSGKTSTQKILLIQTDQNPDENLISLLKQAGDLHIETDSQQAEKLIQENNFDVVVRDGRQVTSSASFKASAPRLGVILDSINQAVCLVDIHGHIVWSNSKITDIPPGVIERVSKHCQEMYKSTGALPTGNRPRSISLISDKDRYFDTTITPMAAEQGESTRLVVVITEITRSRRMQLKMDAIDNAGRELVRFDADNVTRMDVRQRLELMEEKIIRLTHDLLQYNNFAIRLLDKNSNKLELVLCAGLPHEAQQIDIYAGTENSGISGYVAATGRSYICPDVSKDPRYLVGIDNAKSSLTVPLRLHDHVLGIFNIESDQLAAFTEDDRQFAEIFGRYIAIALHILNLLVFERHATTDRLADNVSAEIAGPLGDILADASTLMEDYIGHDDLRHRLQAIADNVVTIRDSIKQVTKPVGGILGSTKKVEATQDPLLVDKKVLVVDDEEVIRLTIRDVLHKYGCDVEVARDGQSAIAMLKQRQYDLIISDIKMPDVSGYDVFKASMETRPDCPVMFITGFGYDPNHSIVKATPEGLAAVLYKPFKVDELLASVRAAVTS